ncbi:hypothetical protein E4U53_004764, partial [Claviceps sorghi]
RRIFRRGSDQESQVSSNDTEYAFRRSRRFLSGLKNALLGRGAFAKIALFVFAVLYVFQNEVTIRVARTLNKRLRSLTERVEHGDDDLSEADLRVFDGWRWRRRSKLSTSITMSTTMSTTTEARDRHFRNLYAKPTDFQRLARLDPDFAAVVKGRDLDFRDPAAVMQLTKTLLRLDFGIKIHLPDDRLCPPVPNRHNYILWLKDLLDTSSYDGPGQKRTGLDIGTGASCIYPLLGCVQRPWSFVATGRMKAVIALCP